MGHVIKSVFLCQCPSVGTLTVACISWSIFTKIDTDIRTPKVKTSSLGGGQYRTTPSPIVPQNSGPAQDFQKIDANINVSNPISALNVRESPKFSRL